MKKIITALMLTFSLFVSPALLAEMVNINKASAAVLQENLKGIGEKKAQAIVAYRKEFGAFKTLDEIMEVKGIGAGIFKKIKAEISLDKGIADLAGEKPTKATAKTTNKTVIRQPVKKQAAEKMQKPAANDKKVRQDIKPEEKDSGEILS